MINDQIAAAALLAVRNAQIAERNAQIAEGVTTVISGGNQTIQDVPDEPTQNLGAIIGGSIGAAAFLAGVITLAVCCTMKRDKDRKKKQNLAKELKLEHKPENTDTPINTPNNSQAGESHKQISAPKEDEDSENLRASSFKKK